MVSSSAGDTYTISSRTDTMMSTTRGSGLEAMSLGTDADSSASNSCTSWLSSRSPS
jgi:hypothetical protein